MTYPTPAHLAQGLLQLPTAAFGTPAEVNPGKGPDAGDDGEDDSNLPTKGSLLLMTSLDELHDARTSYIVADEMYDGTIGDVFASEAVARLLNQSGANTVEDFNYAKVPVDTITEKLRIRAITASAGDDSQDDDGPDDPDGEADETDQGVNGGTSDAGKKKIAEAAQEKLDELRKHNQLKAEEIQLHLKASKHGECYLFVWPVVRAADNDEDAFDDTVQLDRDHKGKVVGVDMFVNSAYTVRMYYDPENPLKPTHVLKNWDWLDVDNDTQRQRATLYFEDRVERWVTTIDGDASKREDWVPYVEDGEQWPAPNPTGRLPFFHFRNDRVYGRPEHQAAYGPQRMINKLVTSHAATIDYQSFPQRYALLDPKGDDLLQNFIDPDNPEDDDDDPEGNGHSQLRASPAALWKLPAQSVGQFSAADPQVFMGPLDRYIKSISELCGIPLDRFVGYTTPPSGESRKAANEPLYEKIGAREDSYGAVWEEAYEFALGLLGLKDITVTVKWRPIEVASGLDDWNIIGAKIANGVPVKQALMEAGYPEDEVELWLTDETGADLTRRVNLLVQIGTAITGLSAGVGVGMISAPQAGEIIARIIGAIGEQLPDLDAPVELHPIQAQQQMELQSKARGQQLSEHMATAPPSPQFDPQGQPVDQGPPRELPPMPPPPPPVKVGT